MDRSTEVTIRSALVIGCMILVPLWAVLGPSWSKALHTESSSESPANATTRPVAARHEPRRELSTTFEPAPSDSLSRTTIPPPPALTSAELPSSVVPGNNVAGQGAIAPPSVASGATSFVEPVAQPTTVPPPISTAERIATSSPSAIPQVSITGVPKMPAVHPVVPVSMAQIQPQPPSEPTPVTPGDWFQWTESRLRGYGATQFILESAGEPGGYRFRCKAPLPNDPGFSRHFEATAPTALDAMQDVLRQVDAWRFSVR